MGRFESWVLSAAIHGTLVLGGTLIAIESVTGDRSGTGHYDCQFGDPPGSFGTVERSEAFGNLGRPMFEPPPPAEFGWESYLVMGRELHCGPEEEDGGTSCDYFVRVPPPPDLTAGYFVHRNMMALRKARSRGLGPQDCPCRCHYCGRHRPCKPCEDCPTR